MIRVLSTASCPRCKILEQYLSEHKIAHFSKEVDEEALTDMRVAGYFKLECPIIEAEGEYHGPDEFFEGMMLDKEKLRGLL
jgi:glutaredoxin